TVHRPAPPAESRPLAVDRLAAGGAALGHLPGSGRTAGLAGDLAAAYLAPPRTGLPAAFLDEPAEPLQVPADLALQEAEHVGRLLGCALGLVPHPDRHPAADRRQGFDLHRAGLADAGHRVPGDPAVRALLDDLRVELPGDPGHAGHPVRTGVVDLPDL